MASELTLIRKFVEPVQPGLLYAAIQSPDSLETVALDLDPVDFQEFRNAIDQVRRSGGTNSLRRGAWDRMLVEPFHRALAGLSVSDALDMGLWHWLCIQGFPDLVRERWAIDAWTPDQGGAPPGYIRFLGTPTLSGFSRNCLARLWWAGQTLYSDDDGYQLVKGVFEPQDLFTAVFERDLVLNRKAARACVGLLRGKDGSEVKVLCKRLSQWATTIQLELLDEEDIRQLMEQAF
jgi:hypothetical protein